MLNVAVSINECVNGRKIQTHVLTSANQRWPMLVQALITSAMTHPIIGSGCQGVSQCIDQFSLRKEGANFSIECHFYYSIFIFFFASSWKTLLTPKAVVLNENVSKKI